MLNQVSNQQRLEGLLQKYRKLNPLVELYKQKGFRLRLVLSNGFTLKHYDKNVGIMITLGSKNTTPKMIVFNNNGKTIINNYPLLSKEELSNNILNYVEEI
jgi:hypothetical protein